MAISCHECFFVFLFLINFTSFAVGELLCHHLLTAVVQGKESLGVLTTDEFIFEKNYYQKYNNTHYRVCICTKVPCLRKCCPLKHLFMNRSCEPFDIDIKPEVYTSDLKLIPDYGIQNFHRVYGNTCKNGFYFLQQDVEPSEEYFLLVNGTLSLPYEGVLQDTSHFCFENVAKNPEGALRGDTKLEAFVCFPDIPQEDLIVYPIGMIISMPFLLITFIVYSLPELRNLHGKNLMCHVASLLTAYINLVVVQLSGPHFNLSACIVCGFLIEFAFLATFFWLNVMCFDIWSAFSGFGKFTGNTREKENKKFIFYSLYAWGCPTVILIVTVTLDFAPNIPDFIIKPGIGMHSCFFHSKLATLVYFYAPMAFVIICDITLFTLTAIKICKVRRETKVLKGKESRRNVEASKQRFNLYLKLFMVMGINWVTELISWAFEGPKELWYLTDVMNSLQGIFIFWIFVCSKKIKNVLLTRFCPKYASRDTDTHTSSLKMSMSANSSGPNNDSIIMNNLSGKKTGKAI